MRAERAENLKSFIYLGRVITNDPNSCFTEHRIKRAAGKFFELNSVLCDKNVNLAWCKILE